MSSVSPDSARGSSASRSALEEESLVVVATVEPAMAPLIAGADPAVRGGSEIPRSATTERSRRLRPQGRRATLLMVVTTQFLIAADITVANVALPVIQEDLGFDAASLSWVINGYLVAVTGTVLIAGRLADAFGHRRMYMAGVALISVFSVACGLAVTPSLLVAARVGQGVGAAIATSAGMAILLDAFTGDAGRTRALALLGAGGILGSSVGLVAGAALTQWASWRWVFLVKLPVGIVIILAALLLPAHARPPESRHVDVLSALLVGTGLGVFVYAVVSVDDHGLIAPVPMSLGPLGALLLGAFLFRQRSSRRPLLPLHLLQSRRLLCGSFVGAITSACLLGQFFLQAQLVQAVGGLDSWETGLAFLPINITIALCSLLLARPMVARFGASRVLPASGSITVLGLLLYVRQGAEFNYVTDMLPSLLILGVGAGLTTVTAMVVAVADADPDNSGLISGFVQMSQQMGGALGVAILASVSSAVSAGTSGAGATSLEGYRVAFFVAAGMALVGALAALLLRPGHGPASVT